MLKVLLVGGSALLRTSLADALGNHEIAGGAPGLGSSVLDEPTAGAWSLAPPGNRDRGLSYPWAMSAAAATAFTVPCASMAATMPRLR